ncbi:MAG: DUF4956 domain-containing protein [Cyclobacteriaceae bacterium]|nr:DUF4956 domain-containing protein [Cyclobacteriaceae bacterium]
MLHQYLSESSYFEFPSFAVAIFTILLALVLSTVIALTYKFTYQEENFPNKFFQAIVLSSTVAAMVMMAVGDNLAVGFGVLGAVSIIRFRTLIKSPRNIIFMFASLSIGISTGVFGFAIAISGTVIFCITVLLLYYSPYGKLGDRKMELIVTILDQEALNNLLGLIESEKLTATVVRIRSVQEDKSQYSFNVGIKQEADLNQLYKKITEISGLSDIRFDTRDSDEQL